MDYFLPRYLRIFQALDPYLAILEITICTQMNNPHLKFISSYRSIGPYVAELFRNVCVFAHKIGTLSAFGRNHGVGKIVPKNPSKSDSIMNILVKEQSRYLNPCISSSFGILSRKSILIIIIF